MKSKLTSTVATLALTLSLLTLPACDPPKRERLVKIAGYGLQLSALLEANWTLPDSLAAGGVITPARRDEVKGIFEAARVSVDAFNDGMRQALAVESPDYAALVPLVANMVTVLQRLNIGVRNETYRKTLTVIDLSLRSIANFFALQIRQARAHGYAVDSVAGVREVEAYAGRS